MTTPSPLRRPNSRTLAALAPLAALAAALAACGTKEAPSGLEPSGAAGRVRFVNLITDPARNPVNATLEGLPFGVNLAYTGTTPSSLGAPSTAPYAAVLVGDRSVVLRRTADTSVTVATLAFTAAAGEDRSVYAVGGTGGGAVSAFVTTDTNTAPAAGQTRLRVVQLSPTAGAVDVFVTAPGADLAAATPVATSLAYQKASAYFTVAPGAYQVRAVPAGTAPGSRASSVIISLSSTATTFAGGTARTIVTADNSTGGAPLRAFVLTDR